MDIRNILYFNPSKVKLNIENELMSAGWHVYQAWDLSQVDDLIKKHDIKIGLIYIEETETKVQIELAEGLFCKNIDMLWVILIAPSQLHGTRFSKLVMQLIVDFSYDYQVTPINFQRLQTVIERALELNNMNKLAIKAASPCQGHFGMVGSSTVMRNVYRSINKISNSDCPVLITGETGTGKELVASAIHNSSNRKNAPFIAVNCGAFPKELIQSELFGHEKGAFTGAHQKKIGKTEMAQGGTLFLDEIGDLSLELQVNLLRFIQEGKICRVGGLEEIELDVRIISATHAVLKQTIREAKFREDLFYRLNVLNIHLPPLNERGNDLEDLAWYFFQEYSKNKNYKAKGFSQEAMAAIKSHEWMGNVRELINTIQRAIVMSDHTLLSPADLGIERRTNYRKLMTLSESRFEAETKSIHNALFYCKHNKTKAAKLLGISRDRLYKLMMKHSIH